VSNSRASIGQQGKTFILYGIIPPTAYALAWGELYELYKCSVEVYPVLQISIFGVSPWYGHL